MQNTWWLMNFQGTVVILRSKFNMSSIWRFSLFFPATPPLPLQAVSLAPCPLFIFVGVLAWQFFYMYLFRASVRSMSYPPVDFWPVHMSVASRAGLVSDEICLGIIWEISAWFSRRDKAKDPGYEFWHQICRDTKQTRWNTKILNFTPIIASGTLKAVSLQLRWLDWIFLGRYLPSLSLNYVAMSKDIEKRLPQLYYIKMKISYDLGFIAIGVAMAA